MDAPIVFVGEAPGQEEIRPGQRLPLIGPSGEVFWGTFPPLQTLRDEGMDPNGFLILNAAQCRPPRTKNQQKNIANVKRAMVTCRDRLLEQVARHPRKLVVAMGNFALWSLTGNMNYKITQVRGQPIPSPLAEHGILPVVHPAGIMRGTGNYRQYKMDMNYALDILRGHPLKSPVKTFYLVCDTPDRVRRAIKKLVKAPVIDCDIETTGFNPRVDDILALGMSKDPRLVYIFPGAIRSIDRMIELQAHETWMDGQPSMIPYLRGFFRKYRGHMKFSAAGKPIGKGKLCWHNGKFDISFMRAPGSGLEDEDLSIGQEAEVAVDEDTMLMSYVLDENRGIHDLEQVASDLLGAPDYKFIIKQWVPRKKDSYCKIPRTILYNYLALDVGSTGGIRDIMRRRVREDPVQEKLYQHLLRFSETAYWIERRGMPGNRFALERQQRRLQKVLDESIAVVQEEAEKLGVDKYINPGSPQQMAWIFFDVLKYDIPEGHERSTQKEVVAKLPQSPIVKAYRAFKVAQKAKGTYADALLRAIDPVTGRIHPGLLIHGTRTGRLSHKVVANIPRDKRLRGMFAFEVPQQSRILELPKPYLITKGFSGEPAVIGGMARGGRLFLKADLDQAELRVLAAMSGDPELCAIYLSNTRKLHREVACEIWGSPGTTEGKKSGEFKWGNEEYMRAKALNFGIIYGREEFSIAIEFGIPVGEAKGYIDMWKNKFPVAWKFIEDCRKKPLEMKTMVTPFGRKKRHWIVTRENVHGLQNEAANFPEQSIANDIVLEASNQLAVPFRKLDVHTVFLVHDEILLDVPDDIGVVREARHMVAEALEQAPKTWGITRVPFKADTSVGRRWGVYRGTDRKGAWNEYLQSKIHLVTDAEYTELGRGAAD
jgi:uracil-DNA glycosylase family 4